MYLVAQASKLCKATRLPAQPAWCRDSSAGRQASDATATQRRKNCSRPSTTFDSPIRLSAATHPAQLSIDCIPKLFIDSSPIN